MAISLLDNIAIKKKSPNVERDLFATIADMVAYNENYLPDVFECNVIEDGNRYRYNRTNIVDENLGRWRIVESGGSASLIDYYKKTETDALLEGYVAKEDGKGLSANDLTDELKEKYDKAEENVQSDWNETDETSDAFIKNKPTIPSIDGLATETFVTNKIAEAQLNGSDVDISGLATKEELATKADTTHTHTLADVTDYEAPDLSDYALKTDIPSTEGFVTEESLSTTLEEYAKSEEITEYDDTALVERVDNVETVLESKADVTDIPDVSNFVEKEEGKGLFSGSYNDLADKPTIPSVEGLVSEETLNTTLADYVKTDELPDGYDDTALTNRVKTIEDDYLTSTDKTELTAAIATAKSEAIETVLGENVDADFDTLKEVANWIQSDTTASAELVTRVTDVEKDIDSLETFVNNKVDKVSGKGLSTNDYTTSEKNKLSGIASGAEVNVQSDWNVTDTTSDAFIKNKPTIPTKTSQLTNDSGFKTTDNNTTYSLSKSGSTITLTGSDGSTTSVTDSNTTYSNFVKSGSSAKAGLVPAPSTTAGTTKYLREDGTWQVPPDTKTDTKNTTGTTNKVDTKLFLAGATSQGANPQTYSNANVYIGTDNCLYSNGKKVVHEVTITTDSDFDTFTETGIYHIDFTDGSNRPCKNHGTLYVDTEVGTDYQLFIPDSVHTVTYKRSYDNTNKAWKAWTTQKLTDTNTTYSNMTAATSSAAGKAGLVPAPAAGAQAKFLRGDGTWQTPTNTTYSNFVKSGSGAKAGLVPAPSTTAGTTKYLREDGTWTTPPDTNTTYSTATQSAQGLMSASDKTKLDGIATGANKTTVDSALSSTSTNPVQNKVINSALSGKASTSVATSSANGLMSSTDKAKLDAITASADAVSVTQKLTSGTEIGTVTINGTDTKLYAPTNTDTKNTAGSTDSSSKLFLVGATSQAANPKTYSHDTAYIGADGHLYSNGLQTVNLSGSQALTNKTYNGYTLAAACAKAVTDSSSAGAISTGTGLVTERDVYYGLPTINNSHAYTSSTSIYAPVSGGTSGYILQANGSTSTPTWSSVNSLQLFQYKKVTIGIGTSGTVLSYSNVPTSTGQLRLVTIYNGADTVGFSIWIFANKIYIPNSTTSYTSITATQIGNIIGNSGVTQSLTLALSSDSYVLTLTNNDKHSTTSCYVYTFYPG